MRKSILFTLFLSAVFGFSEAGSITDRDGLDSLLDLTYSQLVEDIYHSSALLNSAIEYANDAEDVTDSTKATLHTKLGVIYHLLGKPDEAVSQYVSAIELFEAIGLKGEAGGVYTQWGYSLKERDLQKAVSYMQKGMALQEMTDHSGLGATYDNYGVLMALSEKQDSALFYYRKSLNYKTEHGDYENIPYSLQKISIALAMKGAREEALLQLDRAMEIAEANENNVQIAECWTYYGDIYQIGGDLIKAEANYIKALGLGREHKIDYLVRYIYGVLPEIYYQTGQTEKAYTFLKEGAALRDSMLTSDRMRAVAELETFFETSQKEQKIELLEKEVRISDLKLRLNRRIIALGIAGALLSVLLLLLLRNRQALRHEAAMANQREVLQKERIKSIILGEEKERERMARELHDGLGQLLSAARMHVSSLESEVDEPTREMVEHSYGLIDKACTEVREISHALLPQRIANGNLESALADLASATERTGQVKVDLDLSCCDLSGVKGDKAVAIYRMIQEMTNNSLKHANASIIRIVAERKGTGFKIHYSDNGNDFSPGAFYHGKGIGWANLSSRADLIGAQLQIGNSETGGFKAEIHCA